MVLWDISYLGFGTASILTTGTSVSNASETLRLSMTIVKGVVCGRI